MHLHSLARFMHRFLSRRGESAGLSALRHARGHPFRVGPRKRTVGYVEEAGGTRLAGRAGKTDDFAAAVENLCIIRARCNTQSTSHG
jgi:hypothetical protein